MVRLQRVEGIDGGRLGGELHPRKVELRANAMENNIMAGGECFEVGREGDNNMQLLKPKRDLKLERWAWDDGIQMQT